MSFEIPNYEPSKFTAGDTLEFTRTFDQFNPGEGYILKYALRGPQPINITATTYANGFKVLVAASVTKDYVPGMYYWQSYVENGTEKRTVGNGQMTISRSMANVTDQVFDGRSPAKIALDKVEAILLVTADHREKMYEIDGVRVDGKDTAELLGLRDHYQLLYNQELSSQNIENGRPGRKKILTRFLRH